MYALLIWNTFCPAVEWKIRQSLYNILQLSAKLWSVFLCWRPPVWFGQCTKIHARTESTHIYKSTPAKPWRCVSTGCRMFYISLWHFKDSRNPGVTSDSPLQSLWFLVRPQPPLSVVYGPPLPIRIYKDRAYIHLHIRANLYHCCTIVDDEMRLLFKVCAIFFSNTLVIIEANVSRVSERRAITQMGPHIIAPESGAWRPSGTFRLYYTIQAPNSCSKFCCLCKMRHARWLRVWLLEVGGACRLPRYSSLTMTWRRLKFCS